MSHLYLCILSSLIFLSTSCLGSPAVDDEQEDVPPVTTFANLHDDVVFLIFSELYKTEIIKFSMTSKKYLALGSDFLSLKRTHLNRFLDENPLITQTLNDEQIIGTEILCDQYVNLIHLNLKHFFFKPHKAPGRKIMQTPEYFYAFVKTYFGYENESETGVIYDQKKLLQTLLTIRALHPNPRRIGNFYSPMGVTDIASAPLRFITNLVYPNDINASLFKNSCLLKQSLKYYSVFFEAVIPNYIEAVWWAEVMQEHEKVDFCDIGQEESELSGSIYPYYAYDRIKFIFFPPTMTLNREVKTLCLQECVISHIPESFSEMTTLSTLILEGCRFTNLPEEILNLTQLEKLNLNCNGLIALPEGLSRLLNLTNLSLAFNRLQTFPEALSTLENLKELNLSNQHLEIGTINVEGRYAFNNQIHKIPDQIESISLLQKLDLAGNPIVEISPKLGSLAHLTALAISLTVRDVIHYSYPGSIMRWKLFNYKPAVKFPSGYQLEYSYEGDEILNVEDLKAALRHSES